MKSSSNTPSVREAAADLFPSFSRLPRELRIMIWKEALPGPRIVFLRHRRLSHFRCRRVWSNCETNAAGTKKFFGRDKYSHMVGYENNRRRTAGQLTLPIYGFRPQATSIPLLYVCRESFAIASQIYTRAFGTAEAYPQTWFAYDRDTLYLDFDHLLTDLSLDVRKVENLALCNQPVDFNSRFPGRYIDERFLAEILAYFGSIKTLTLVNPQHTTLDRGELVITDVTSIGRSFLYFRGLDVAYNRAFDKRVVARQLSPQEIDWDTRRHFPLKIESIEQYQKFPEPGQQSRFEMPKIERKTITALETKMMHESLMSDYRRSKERHRTRIYLQCPGYEDLKLEAGETMTMGELLKEFLKCRKISTPVENTTLLGDGEELDRSATVYDLNLMNGDKLWVALD